MFYYSAYYTKTRTIKIKTVMIGLIVDSILYQGLGYVVQ